MIYFSHVNSSYFYRFWDCSECETNREAEWDCRRISLVIGAGRGANPHEVALGGILSFLGIL
jgi:hypothetical protein